MSKKKKEALCQNQCKTVRTHGMTLFVQYQQWPKKTYLARSSTTNMHCTASRKTKTNWRHFKELSSLIRSWHICLPFVRHWVTRSLRDQRFHFLQFYQKCVNSKQVGSSLCCLLLPGQKIAFAELWLDKCAKQKLKSKIFAIWLVLFRKKKNKLVRVKEMWQLF